MAINWDKYSTSFHPIRVIHATLRPHYPTLSQYNDNALA